MTYDVDHDLLEYLYCPDVYYGQPCGDGHTRESADTYLAWVRAREARQS